MANNQKKIRELPLSNQIFLYSYFLLLLITLGGFVSAAIANNVLTLTCTILLGVVLVVNVVAAFIKL